MQKEVADQLGVVPWTILNWEKGRTEPPIAAVPVIKEFLGYDPNPPMPLTKKWHRAGIGCTNMYPKW